MRLMRMPVCLLWVLLTTPLLAGDWPTYRGDRLRSGSTAEAVQLPLKEHWVYESPSPPRLSWAGQTGRTIEGHVLRDRVNYDDAFHVAVVGQRVYFGSSADHQVHCRDLSTGKTIWTFTTGGPVRMAPTVAQGRVYVGSDDGRVYCLNAKDGSLIWQLRAGPSDEWFIGRGEMINRWPVRTGVLVDGGVAYFGAGIFPHEDVFLYAVRAEDGRVIWKQDNISESDAGRNDLSPQGYLLASETTLFVPSGRSLPAAIDRKTGAYRYKANASWRSNGGGVIGGYRAVLADGQLYSGGEHHYLAIDQQKGTVGYGYIPGHEMVMADGSAFVATGSYLARIHRAEYAEASRKRHALEMAVQSLARRLRGKIKNADQLRKQYNELKKKVREMDSVGVLWKRKSPHDAALLATANVLFAGGENVVEGFDIQTGKPLWSAGVKGRARGLAFSQGRLLVSTDTGRIYCFNAAGLKTPPAAAPQRWVKNPYPQNRDAALFSAAAEQILKNSGITSGFCLVLGSQDGRLAFELSKRSHLKIYVVDPDENNVARARRLLQSTGWYGHRITVHQADFADIPYSNYFANLIVSERHLRSGKLPGNPEVIVRHLKPVGGVICFGHPQQVDEQQRTKIVNWLKGTGLGEYGTLKTAGNWITLTRGRLPDAGDWTHLYGDAGNTASSEDRRVRGGLGVLWFGDPGPGEMVNRHEGAVGPLAVNGKLFVQGTDSVMAYDAYNGRFLWRFGDKEALRTGVFQNYNPGNLVASKDSLFVMIKNRCVQLDAETGRVKAIFGLPPGKNEGKHQWGYVAYHEGILYGTATIREELAARLRRRGRKTADATDALFAIDTKTGKHLWTYQGKSISHRTIALGPSRVYFIDSSLTPQQRAEMLRQDKSHLEKLTGEARKKAEAELKRKDLRLAVALNARTGKLVWSKPVDVTDCSEIGTGGGKLTLIYKNNVLVLCGANANGHYWKQFLAGEFKRRRLLALNAEDGTRLWAKDANYRHRPIVIEDQIIAEPWSFDLYTGVQKTRPHPLTGQEVPWSIIRPGHHCGMLTGCPNMLMFRSGYTGFYDLTSDSGTRHFAGHRLGCWINAIPANGLVMIPEASAGCVCLFSIASTITMEPRKARHPWTIYSAVGPQTPVRHMHLNLGAPGDRKDARGTIWLAYPRPNPHKVTGLDLKLNLNEARMAGGGYVSFSERSHSVQTSETPWIYNSTARGIIRWTFPLRGKKDGPATYTLKLHFAELDESVRPGERLFDVKVQGKTVLPGVDVAKEAGGTRRGITKLIRHIPVGGALVLELVPRSKSAGERSQPILNAVEVFQEEANGGEKANGGK